MCPAVRASYYSQEAWEEYMAYSNENVMFIPLIEDVEGVDNAEEILSLLKPGTDAVGLGLGDIANSLLTKKGEKVQWQHPYLAEAGAKVMGLATEDEYSRHGHGLAKGGCRQCQGSYRQRYKDPSLLPRYPFLGGDVPQYH